MVHSGPKVERSKSGHGHLVQTTSNPFICVLWIDASGTVISGGWISMNFIHNYSIHPQSIYLLTNSDQLFCFKKQEQKSALPSSKAGCPPQPRSRHLTLEQKLGGGDATGTAEGAHSEKFTPEKLVRTFNNCFCITCMGGSIKLRYPKMAGPSWTLPLKLGWWLGVALFPEPSTWDLMCVQSISGLPRQTCSVY